ncbi:hypothetical protein BHE74_00034396 [Ensete ventricosum]|nr:hypothetical protein BHE74_00034396 [Ensete ventricosum]
MTTTRRNAMTSRTTLRSSYTMIPRALHEEALRAFPIPYGPMKKKIDVIIVGPTSGEDSASARKAYARAVVENHPRLKDEPKIAFEVGDIDPSLEGLGRSAISWQGRAHPEIKPKCDRDHTRSRSAHRLILLSVAPLLARGFRGRHLSGNDYNRGLLARGSCSCAKGAASEGALLTSTFVFLVGRSRSQVALASAAGPICDREGPRRSACPVSDCFIPLRFIPTKIEYALALVWKPKHMKRKMTYYEDRMCYTPRSQTEACVHQPVLFIYLMALEEERIPLKCITTSPFKVETPAPEGVRKEKIRLPSLIV